MRKPTASHEWELITPTTAEKYLEKNRDNRTLRTSQVEFLTRAMQDGQFLATHQGVAFTKDGTLVDGQHRLHAVVRSKESVWLLVVRGLDDSAKQVLDCGITRTVADRLKISSRHAAIAGSMLRTLLDRGKSASYETEIVLDSFATQISELEDIGALKSARKTACAPIIAAGLVRLFEYAGSSTLDVVLQRIRTVTLELLTEMDPLAETFYKYCQHGKYYGTSGQRDLMARAWVAFDPARVSQKKIQITDVSTQIGEIREVFHRATAENLK